MLFFLQQVFKSLNDIVYRLYIDIYMTDQQV